jgi:hypothetical protein
MNTAEVTVSSIISKSILSLDVKTTTDKARQKMQEKKYLPLGRNPG